MIAGAGSGKTTLLMTLLGLHKGTAFVIDPKGQITRAMATRCGSGGRGIFGKGMKVAILDPFRLVPDAQGASWNPFVEIERAVQREGPDAAVRFAAKMADGLIVKHSHENPFWPGTAKELLTGLILHIHTTEPPERRTLIRLYDLLCNGLPEKTEEGKNAFSTLLRAMRGNQAYGGVIAASANTLADTGNDTFGNVLITAREQLQWLKLPELRAVCGRSDFHLEELKTGKLNLFICAPVTDLQGPLAGWFRLLAVMGLYTFESIPGRRKHSCLFALDEFPSLGNIKAIETAAPVMRSYGVRLLAITQDIEKLRQSYPDAWGSFLGNAEAIWWMGTNHDETATILSKILGLSTQTQKVKTGWFASARAQANERSVMDPEQVKRFLDSHRGNILVTRNGRRPLRLKNAPYFTELPVCFYDADPDFKETAPRSFTRALFYGFVRAGKHLPRQTHLSRHRLSKAMRSRSPLRRVPRQHPPPGMTQRQLLWTIRLEEFAERVESETVAAAIAELFGERGNYPNPRTRRLVMEWATDQEFESTGAFQLRLEKWAGTKLPKDRAEDVIAFVDEAMESGSDA